MSRSAQRRRNRNFGQKLKWARWIASDAGRFHRLTELRQYPWPWWVNVALIIRHESRVEPGA